MRCVPSKGWMNEAIIRQGDAMYMTVRERSPTLPSVMSFVR